MICVVCGLSVVVYGLWSLICGLVSRLQPHTRFAVYRLWFGVGGWVVVSLGLVVCVRWSVVCVCDWWSVVCGLRFLVCDF